jgi:Protein of unknown function (DUF2934)
MHRDPLYDEIAKVAYDLFERKGKKHGHHLNDWFEAEKIVKARHAEESVKKGAAIAGIENAEPVRRRKRKGETTETKIGAPAEYGRRPSVKKLHP